MINYEELFKWCLGNLELVDCIVCRFSEKLLGDIEELMSVLKFLMFEEICWIVYWIKGLFVSVGVEDLYLLVVEFEEVVKSGWIEELFDWIEWFVFELRRIV